jgi:hypothetical protein
VAVLRSLAVEDRTPERAVPFPEPFPSPTAPLYRAIRSHRPCLGRECGARQFGLRHTFNAPDEGGAGLRSTENCSSKQRRIPAPTQGCGTRNCGHSPINAIDHKARHPLVDNFRNRASPKPDDRGAIGHCFDHDQPEGSGQSIGNSSAIARPRNSPLSWSPISPMNSTPGIPARRAILIAFSTRFSEAAAREHPSVALVAKMMGDKLSSHAVRKSPKTRAAEVGNVNVQQGLRALTAAALVA